MVRDALARRPSSCVCPVFCAWPGVNLGGDLVNPRGFARIVAQPAKAVRQPRQAMLIGGHAE